MGVVHFHSGAVVTNRFIFDIPKVTLKPLLLIPAHQNVRNGGLGFIQFYYRASLIQGVLTQDNFRPKGTTTFRADNHLVASAGFLVDPVALVRLYDCINAFTGSCISLTLTHLPSTSRTIGPWWVR